MEIWATRGSFSIAMSGLDGFLYKWNKDKTLSIWENKKAKYKTGAVSIQTNSGDFIEAVDGSGKVVWQGGDGEWCHIPLAKEPFHLRFRSLPKPEMSKAAYEKARRKVTRYLVSDSPYSAGIQGKLTDAIAWMNKKLSEIPKAYRTTAEIEFRNRHEYGDSYEHVEITYQEPETDEELTFRLTVEAERARVAAAKRKAKFNELKTEFCG